MSRFQTRRSKLSKRLISLSRNRRDGASGIKFLHGDMDESDCGFFTVVVKDWRREYAISEHLVVDRVCSSCWQGAEHLRNGSVYLIDGMRFALAGDRACDFPQGAFNPIAWNTA